MTLPVLTPESLAQAQQSITGTFYWEKKDLPAFLNLASSLLELALKLAASAETNETANQFRDLAIRNTYNIASMTWPGWDEAGIDISAEQQLTGLSAAEMNVEMAAAQSLSPQRRQMGLWILGVQELAAGRFPEARATLLLQRQLLVDNDLPGAEVTAGYLTFIDDLETGSNNVLVAIDQLKASSDKETAEQGGILETAIQILRQN